jgi:predicted enzyme related to lactoylglutathione lyase
MNLGGIMIGSENPKVLGEFYTKIFGKPGMQQDEWYGFKVGNGGLMIGSHSEVKGKSTTPARIIITIEAEDVKKEFSRIKELGGEVIAEPYQPDHENNAQMWLATLADPDGNYLQLSTPWINNV